MSVFHVYIPSLFFGVNRGQQNDTAIVIMVVYVSCFVIFCNWAIWQYFREGQFKTRVRRPRSD